MEKRCCGCMQLKTQSPLCEHCGYNETIDNLSHQLPINTVLNERFRLGKVLGQGGFGITYIGWDQKEEAPVAVKEYYPRSVVTRDVETSLEVSCTDDSGRDFFRQYRKQFLEEAKMLEKFSHVPQIVNVRMVFEENNTVYMVMEYVQGTDLSRYIRMVGLLTPRQAFQIFRPVILALSKVHESGLIHKDISPDNIMILPDGKAKLLDFGAAQDVLHTVEQDQEVKSTITVVKHGFAPPEQYQKDGYVGPWTDVYALCASLYYCMTGKLPKPSKERFEDKELNWDSIPGLTPGQIAVLSRGMEPMPASRYANVRELYEALFPPRTKMVTEVEEITDKDEPDMDRSAEKKKKLLPILAAAAAAVVVLGAALILLRMPRGWKQENGITCYYKSGRRATGIQTIGKDTYLFTEDGAMTTGWQEVDGVRYLLGEDGVMVSGVVTLEDGEYHFDEDGAFRYRIRDLSREDRKTVESEQKQSFEKNNGGTQSWTYRCLEKPIKNCTHFAVEMKLTEYKNGNTEQWKFAYRDLNGQWHTVGGPFGLTNDGATLDWTPEEPVSFDAYVWYCVSIGNMWNFERSYDLTAATVIDYEI